MNSFKNIIKQYESEMFADEIYFVQKRLDDLRAKRANIKQFFELFEDQEFARAELASIRRDVHALMRRMQYFRNIANKINKILFHFLSKCKNYDMFEACILTHPMCKGYTFQLKKLLANIRQRYLAYIDDINLSKMSLKYNKEFLCYSRKHNKFSLLPVDECDMPSHEEFDYLDSEYFGRSPFVVEFCEDTEFVVDYSDYSPPEENLAPIRDPELILKLRLRIVRLISIRVNSTILLDKYLYYIAAKKSYSCEQASEVAVPEMADKEDAHGGAPPSTSKAGNVILTQSQKDTPEIVGEPSKFDWVSMTTSDVVGRFPTMTDRWLKVKEFEWTTTSDVSKPLATLELPRDIVLNTEWDMCDMVNASAFKVHRYVLPRRIQIKFLGTTNKFQVGQLQAAWFYEPHLDQNFDRRTNIWCGSQTQHCLISANSGNEVTMTINFKYHAAMLATKDRSDLLRSLSMGKLIINVLNALTIPDGGPNKAYMSIFVKMEECAFTGQIAGSLNQPRFAVPQMDRIVKAAEAALEQVVCPNRDLPPAPQAPAYMVPTASHSWSYGTGAIEPLQSLRLNARGQTPHPDKEGDNLAIANIVNKFGLVTSLSFSTATRGIFFDCDASPMIELENYNSYKRGGTDSIFYLTRYNFTPVAVISSLFAYWRGGLEFRFDGVASDYHSCRLIVGYVPGAVANDKVEVKHLLAGPHMIYDIRGSCSFTYSVPYVYDRPFASRRGTGNYAIDAVVAPSRLYVGILNPLIVMQNVSDTVYLNVYMRAAPDFEVAVPVQPSIGLGWHDRVMYSSKAVIHALEGYYPYYAGTYHNFMKSQYLCMRFGTTSGQVAYFDASYLRNKTVWPKENVEGKGFYYKIAVEGEANTAIDYDGKPIRWLFAVMVQENKMGILVPAISEAAARSMAIKSSVTKGVLNEVMCSGFAFWAAKGTTGNNYSTGNPTWIPVEVKFPPLLPTPTPPTEGVDECGAFEVIVPQNERSTNDQLMKVSSLKSTGHGRILFGEAFDSVKDLTRRYQLYAALPITMRWAATPGTCLYTIPLLPQGLDLDLGTAATILEIANRARDGPIPIVLSGFRYCRGGMKIRLVCPTDKNLIMWVQHRADRKLRRTAPVACSSVTTAEGLFNHGYATYVQDTGVNSLIEIEIPYYRNCVYSLLQRPIKGKTQNSEILDTKDEAFAFGLGELAIGYNSKVGVNTTTILTAFYALADDFNVSEFQGFPEMCVLDEITDATQSTFGEEAVPQMGLVDKIFGGVKEDIKAEVKQTVSDTVDSATKDMSDKLSGIREKLSGMGFADILNTSAARVAIGQLTQLYVNFSWKGLAVALAAILIELGCVTSNALDSALKALQDLILYVRKSVVVEDESGNKLNHPDDVEEAFEAYEEFATPQMDNEKATTGIITLLWAGVCSLFSVCDFAQGRKTWSSFLTKDLNGVMRSSNVIFIFIRNIVSTLDDMKEYCFGLKNPKIKVAKDLADRYPEFLAWTEEVAYLIDPSHFENKKYQQSFQIRVSLAYAEGTIWYGKLATIEDTKIMHCVIKFYDKITELHRNLVALGSDGFVRREPFTVWQCGEAGVGKSVLGTHIIHKLLEVANIPIDRPPIYVHEASSEFWEEDGNPAMVVDDMFNIRTGALFERQLALLFAVVSPVLLTPPKARLEQKGKHYNPDIFWMNSNYDYLSFNNICMNAVHRRRNFMYKAVPTTLKKDGCIHCDQNMALKDTPYALLSDFHHLRFYVYTDPINQKNNVQDGPFTYEVLLEKMKTAFMNHRMKSTALYKERIEYIVQQMALHEPDEYMTMKDRLMYHKAKLEKDAKERMHPGMLGKLKDQLPKVWDYMKEMVRNEEAVPEIDGMSTVDSAILSGYCHQEMKKFVFEHEYNKVFSPAFRAKLEACYQHFPNNISTMQHVLLLSQLGETHNLCTPDIVAALLQANAMERQKEIDVSTPKQVLGAFGYINYKFDYFLSFMQSTLSQNGRSFKRIQIPTPDGRGFEITPPLLETSYEKVKVTVVENGKNVQRIRIKQHTQEMEPCWHWTMKLGSCRYDPSGKIMVLDKDNFLREIEEGECNCLCFWAMPIIKYCIFESLLKSDRLLKVRYSQAQRDSSLLPVGMQWCNRLTIEQSTWKKIFTSITEVAKSAILGYSEILAYFAYIVGIVVKLVKAFAPVFIGMAGVLGAFACMKAAKSVVAQEEDQEEWEEVTGEGAYNAGTSQHRNLNDAPRFATAQSSNPQTEIAIDRCLENMFKITMIDGNSKLDCVGVVLADRKLLLLRHYFEEFDACVKNNRHCKFFGMFPYRRDKQWEGTLGIEFNYNDIVRTYYNVKNKNSEYKSNIVIMHLPRMFPQCKSIEQFIATAEDHRMVQGSGTLITSKGRLIESVQFKQENGRPLVIRESDTTSRVVMENVYSYNLHGKGMCGSLLLSPNLQRPIVGIHVAGVEVGNMRGMAEPLSINIFNNIPRKEQNYEALVLPKLDSKEFSKLDIQSAIFPLGTVDPQHSNHQSGVSQLTPSLISGTYPVRTATAPLSKGDSRLPPGTSPLAEGCAHMGRPPLDFPASIQEEARFDLNRVIIQNVIPIRKDPILTLEEAICGNPNFEGLQPLEWSTSPGYPLKKESTQAGKKWLFDLEETQDGFKLKGIHPKLHELLTIDENCRRNKIKPFTIFSDCLKDTCMPIEKCSKVGKTRVFSISPVQFTIAFRRYFGIFMSSYRKAQFKAEHAIGINAESREWTMLAAHLQQKGSKIVAGDYKNYGHSLMLSLVAKAFDIVLEWYKRHGATEEEQTIRRVLVEEVLHANHLALNLIFTCPCGIPSGSPITDIMNSMVNSLYIRVNWKLTTGLPMLDFTKHCVIVTYGDDVGINITDEIAETFNTETIAKTFGEYCIGFTDVDKSDSIIKYRTLTNFQFLKREFKEHPYRTGVWLAPLDKVSIEGCSNWVTKKNNLQQATVQNCEQAVMLAHSHGEEYYNEMISKFEANLREHSLTFRYKSWSELDHERYSEM